MSLKYVCPLCGTPLGYKGLCWKCKSAQEREAVLAWTPEQIKEKQDWLIQNIQRLADMEDPEFADFWHLLSYLDAITPEIQRAALSANIYYPCELYYSAPEDVRDGLISALLSSSCWRNSFWYLEIGIMARANRTTRIATVSMTSASENPRLSNLFALFIVIFSLYLLLTNLKIRDDHSGLNAALSPSRFCLNAQIGDLVHVIAAAQRV